MAFVVVYDACVLYPGTLRDLLIRIHQAGLVQAEWTEEVAAVGGQRPAGGARVVSQGVPSVGADCGH